MISKQQLERIRTRPVETWEEHLKNPPCPNCTRPMNKCKYSKGFMYCSLCLTDNLNSVDNGGGNNS